MADVTRPLEVAFSELDRRVRDRWVIAGIVLLGTVGVVAMLMLDEAAATVRPWAVGALGAVVVLYAVSVAVEERRARRTIRALVAEREWAAGLSERVRALETVHSATQDLAAASDLPEVFTRLVHAALALTDARSGGVLLRVGDTLTVAASAGPDAPEPGTEIPRGEGPAWAAVVTGDSLVSDRGAGWGPPSTASSVAAPLTLPDRIVGALVVERGAPAFSAVDRLAVALFAQFSAYALRNATRLDLQLERVTELEQERASRATTTAGIVHDLRAPLAAAIGYVQLLRESGDALTEVAQEAVVADVLAELGRVRRMVDDLLHAAAAETGQRSRDERVSLAEIAGEAVRTATGLAHHQGAHREVVLRTDAAVVVRGDPGDLMRIATNLVDNAVRHSPAGTPVEVRALRDGDAAVLTVRDHGPGPPADEPLTDLAGLGVSSGRVRLGLYVVRMLVEVHGGEVALRGADGGGTVAEVRLPLA